MICVSINELTVEDCLKRLKGEQLAEIRLEELNPDLEELEILFSQPLKLIATCRPGKLTEKERLDILNNAIISGATYVDIEYDVSTKFRKKIISIANKYNCELIISYHNYQLTPEANELEKLINLSFSSGADICKIACRINDQSDIGRIFSLYDSDKRIIALGMGDKGKLTRIIAPLLGAEFTYVSSEPGKETAPGQLSKNTILEILKQIKNL